MAFTTALNFVVLSAALLLSGLSSKRTYVGAVVLSILTILSSYIAILGYLYDLSALYSVGPYSTVALHTAFLFLTTGMGVLIKEPARGLMRLLTNPLAGGRAARRLLPLALLVPPTLGWLGLEGQRAGLYRAEFGLAAVVVANVVIFAIMILWNVETLNNADAVRREETKFRSLLESSPEAMVIVDAHGRIALVNKQTEEFFGYRRDELFGKPVEMLMPERYRASHVARRDGFIAGATKRLMGRGLELVGLRRDGSEFPIEVSLSPLDAGEDLLVSSTVRDISERKRAEAELNEARKTAEAATLAKSNFLADMSHEIRTPLNGIIGFTELLGRTELSDQQQRYVATLRSAGNGLLALVSDILDLSKLEAGRLSLASEPVSVADALEEVTALMDEAIRKKGLAVHVMIAPDVPPCIVSDALRLRQILLNLISNAVKFTAKGGVSIAITAVTGHDGRRLRYEITDTGIGIAPDKIPLLFEKFTQAHGDVAGKFGGTGLGLAICRELVRRFGGDIGVTSVENRGSTFWFEVPLTPAAVPNRPLGTTPAAKVAGRLLLVEDVAMNQEVASAILSQAGYHVDAAGDGADAVQQLRNDQYDLILMDVPCR